MIILIVPITLLFLDRICNTHICLWPTDVIGIITGVLFFEYEYCQSIIYNKLVSHFGLKWPDLFKLNLVDAPLCKPMTFLFSNNKIGLPDDPVSVLQ